mgnify:CR=1 FL=1
MNLFIAILTDFSHFIKIIMAMNLFGNFEERINKYKIILIATIIALASGIIYFDEKMKIGSIVYFITTYAVFRMWYAEKRKLLLLFSIYDVYDRHYVFNFGKTLFGTFTVWH